MSPPATPPAGRRARAAALPDAVREALAAAPPTPLERPLLLLAAAGVLVCAGYALAAWNGLPATIPIHFGADGRPDGWGSRATLLMMPGWALFMFALLTLAGRRPASYNYPWPLTAANARRQAQLARELLAWLRAALAWMFAVIEVRVIAGARAGDAGPALWFVPALLLMVLGPVAAYFLRSWRAR